MHPILVHITSEQKKILFDNKDKTGVPVAVQIRRAIDKYVKN